MPQSLKTAINGWGPWAMFLWLLLVLACRGMPSADLWWQLAAGRLMLAEGQFPKVDPFSFTASGQPWLNHEWLAEAAMFYLYQHGGLALLHAVRLVMIALAFFIMGCPQLRAGVSSYAVAAAACLALSFAEPSFFFDVRPYMCTYLLLALTFAGAQIYLEATPERGPVMERGVLALPVLFMLWANLHSGVLAGIVVLVLSCLGALWTAPQKVRKLALVSLACLFASVLNPYGVEVVSFSFHFVGTSLWSSHLNEWARPDLFGAKLGFFVFYLGTFAVYGLSWWRGSTAGVHKPAYFLVLCFAGGLAVTAWRHLPLFALVSIPAWTAFFDLCVRQVQRVAEELAESVGRTAQVSWILGACLLVVGAAGSTHTLSRTSLENLSMESAMFPVAGARFLAENKLPARLFNFYGWGGYFIWKLWPGYRVFMDGRANTVYAEQVYRDFLLANQGTKWREILQQYDVHVAVINKLQGNRLQRLLQEATDWLEIYQDDLCEIFVDGSRATADVRQRFSDDGLRYPVQALVFQARSLFDKQQYEAAEKVLQRAQLQDPGVADIYLLMGVVAARQRNLDKAEALTRRALSLDPHLPQAHYNLGAICMARGDRAAAMAELVLELQVAPQSDAAREMLERLRRGQ